MIAECVGRTQCEVHSVRAGPGGREALVVVHVLALYRGEQVEALRARSPAPAHLVIGDGIAERPGVGQGRFRQQGDHARCPQDGGSVIGEDLRHGLGRMQAVICEEVVRVAAAGLAQALGFGAARTAHGSLTAAVTQAGVIDSRVETKGTRVGDSLPQQAVEVGYYHIAADLRQPACHGLIVGLGRRIAGLALGGSATVGRQVGALGKQAQWWKGRGNKGAGTAGHQPLYHAQSIERGAFAGCRRVFHRSVAHVVAGGIEHEQGTAGNAEGARGQSLFEAGAGLTQVSLQRAVRRMGHH